MGLFTKKWDSENYPSYEDYMDAKRNGSLNKNRQYINVQASQDKSATRMSTAQQVSQAGDSKSLESQMQQIEAKTIAAQVLTKAADAKRYRDTSSQYGDSKPFASTTPTLPDKKKGSFRLLFILITLIIAILPVFSNLLDQITDTFKATEVTEEATSVETETVQSETPAVSNILTALPADHFRINSGVAAEEASTTAILDGIYPSETTSLSYGLTTANAPFLKLVLQDGEYSILDNSPFLKSTESGNFIGSDGKLLEECYVEFAFTDLTNDGLKEVLVYYYSEAVYPYVEVFYNTGSDVATYKPLNYFESYISLNITNEGIIQRVAEDGSIFDEILVTADGCTILEN